MLIFTNNLINKLSVTLHFVRTCKKVVETHKMIQIISFDFLEWVYNFRSINEQLDRYGTHYFNHEICSKIKNIRQQIISVEMSQECSRNWWAKSLIKVLVIWNSINTFHFFGQSVTSIETDNQRSCRYEKLLMWPSWYVLVPNKSHLRRIRK